ncbi:hypothetical protein B566_EDAN009223, partial [Ephemera danica]
MKFFLILCLVLSCDCARPREPPVINITGQGQVSGSEVSITRAQRVILYPAIPFAQPPLGALRFHPPVTQPLPSWSDKRTASSPAPACPQSPDIEYERLATSVLGTSLSEQSEDCLYLNVVVPDGNAPSDGWPVVVWFHPGMFQAGSTAQWDGSAMAVKHKIIVVTAAYRLNILGFLCTLDNVSPGNYGMLDQVAALDWVKEKISNFGGSSNNITVFGHGSGGVSVGLHLISPLSAGKFHKAIAMSGNALVPWAVKKPEAEEMKLALIAEKFNCPRNPTLKLVDCLRKIDAPTLAKGTSSADIGNWGPVIDSDYANASYIFLPQDPLELFKDGQVKNMVPLMVGYTDMEEALMFTGTNLDSGVDREQFEAIMLEQISTELNDANMSCTNEQYILDAVLFYYSPQPQTSDTTMYRQKLMDFATEKKYGAGAFLQAVYNSKHSATFLYRFDYKMKTPLVDIPDWVHVPHLYDLPFIWGMPYWPATATPQKIVWNNADKKIADVIMSLWANFIKFANPAQNGVLVKWDAFSEENPGILIVDSKFNSSDVSNFDYKSFSFWNDYYPKVVESASSCCNTTSRGLATVTI